MSKNFLAEIRPVLEARVRRSMDSVSFSAMRRRAQKRRFPLVPFSDRLRKRREGEVAVIAEVKRASPSGGRFPSRDLRTQVRAYEKGGAAAVSVLTEEQYFHGSLEDLSALKEMFPHLPFLRKDFLTHPYEIYESYAAGADAVLLIVRLLDDRMLRELYGFAQELSLGVLLEVERADEIGRALSVEPQVVGVNARDLCDLSVDRARVGALARMVREEAARRGMDVPVVVGESGIDAPCVPRDWDVDAVLVGTFLMRSSDPAAAVRDLQVKRT